MPHTMETGHTDGVQLKLTVPALMTSMSGRSDTTISSYQTASSHLSPSETISSYQTASTGSPFVVSPSTTYSTDVANTSEIGEDDIIIAGGKEHLFVDTPGFDDDTRSDTEILTEVADWLKQTYQAGVKLSGILFLHRITDNRMTNTLVRNLDMFENLCGNGAFSNVRFVTTHWDQLKDNNQGIKTEGELRKKYFNTFLCGGSQVHRFQSSFASAWQIINSLPMEPKVIRIQKEMVDQHKTLWETSAARSLLSWVHRAVEALKNFIRQLEELIQKITSADSSENRRRGKDSEHEKYEKDLNGARKVLRKIENNKSQFYKQPAIDSNHFSRSSSSSSTSTASSWRYVSYIISDRSERSMRRRPCHNPTLSTCSESTVADSSEYESDVSYNPLGPSSSLGSLSRTIQRLQTASATAAQVVIPGFEDAVAIALRISETLIETPNAHRSLSSLMDSASCFLFVINDKYSPTKGYPNSITKSFENIHRQLVNILDLATRLKVAKAYPEMSFTLSLDDQWTITECREAVASALRYLKVS
ncbi:hypothetical protein AGABI2DRAFT_141962 [Agaricus bisporus var. bisporus H97]|uniref:hypothetical protein n=1 Tax=Agaricus bisporus var. bisporus (strain H97 / ATCC MYA-4626 / FGSC 10389) TaxID=936046 RepID=UPI00029F539D|nr:hypothetical protein AGABI2DRAFT_141962 [Agaricus bisporus var. bisporus H97]EKV49348.1 hypothetical protein AGABI2DRAFT_141962 [Agaricus bisporus var. bisporus H97]